MLLLRLAEPIRLSKFIEVMYGLWFLMERKSLVVFGDGTKPPLPARVYSVQLIGKTSSHRFGRTLPFIYARKAAAGAIWSWISPPSVALFSKKPLDPIAVHIRLLEVQQVGPTEHRIQTIPSKLRLIGPGQANELKMRSLIFRVTCGSGGPPPMSIRAGRGRGASLLHRFTTTGISPQSQRFWLYRCKMPPKKAPAGKEKEKDTDGGASAGKDKKGGTKVKVRHILCEKVR